MKLDEAINRFSVWATDYRKQLQVSAEWESEYPHWIEIYDAVEDVISRPPLNDETIERILFVLGRDNEDERVLDILSEHPSAAECVARRGVLVPDSDARWQIAVLLGRLDSPPARELLNKLLTDEHEYVRRRALLALREIDPRAAESVALEWISSEHEYARMVAIDTLATTESKHLTASIEELKDDSSSVVQNRLVKISGRQPKA